MKYMPLMVFLLVALVSACKPAGVEEPPHTAVEDTLVVGEISPDWYVCRNGWLVIGTNGGGMMLDIDQYGEKVHCDGHKVQPSQTYKPTQPEKPEKPRM